MAKITVFGGAGFVGSQLVPALLNDGHHVTVYDIGYYGFHFPHKPNLIVKRADIREIKSVARSLIGCDVVIHLACISNDPSFELDGALAKAINYDCFEPLVIAAKEAGVRRFVYASTSSVYGISDSPDVREDHPFVPVTAYNKYKGLSEPLLFKHQSADFTTTIVRPATVCGYSPRMRLDLSVNILTNLAVNKGEITVYGGAQMRPNIHIADMVRAYQLLLDAPKEKIAGQAFNCGMQNLSIMEIAEKVRSVVSRRYNREIAIKVEPSVDQRSYQLNSDKIRDALGFEFQHTIEDAINDICDAFDAGKIPNPLTDEGYYNVKVLKDLFPEMARDIGMDATMGIQSEQDIHRAKA